MKTKKVNNSSINIWTFPPPPTGEGEGGGGQDKDRLGSPSPSSPPTEGRGDSVKVCLFNYGLLSKTDQKGVVLVIALVMMLVLTLIGFAAVNLTSFESRISGNERVYNNAFYAGDGGVENFRGRVSTGEFVYSVANSGSYQVAIGDSVSNVAYTRTVMPSPGGGGDIAVFKVTSEGVAPNLPVAGRVRIEAVVEAAMMLPQGYN